VASDLLRFDYPQPPQPQRCLRSHEATWAVGSRLGTAPGLFPNVSAASALRRGTGQARGSSGPAPNPWPLQPAGCSPIFQPPTAMSARYSRSLPRFFADWGTERMAASPAGAFAAGAGAAALA